MKITNFREAIKEAAKLGRRRFVLPGSGGCCMETLSSAVREGLAFPIWIGDAGEGKKQFERCGIAASEGEILEEKNAENVLDRAFELLRSGKADILMQGAAPHEAFVNRVLDREKGLRNGKTASFVSVFDPEKVPKLTMLTDTYINNFPTLEEKIGIVENAIRLAGVLGIDAPKIAALSAIEQVNPAIPSTLDAAILAKMSERKQFGAAVIEGPLDIDCAVSAGAAMRKGVQSPVTGRADIYLTPNVESGYLTAQLNVFIAGMPMAGVLMGTSHPVILDLPWVSIESKPVEAALAVLLCPGK